MSTQSDGIELFMDEVERRGGLAERIPGRKVLFEVTGADGQIYCVKLKTKARSAIPWQGSKKDGYPGADTEVDAWVFIDNQADPAESPVVPADFMRNDIARELDLWLRADPSRNADEIGHHKIDAYRVEDWAGHWDLIGLDSDPESETTSIGDEVLTVTAESAGYGDPESNRIVEAAAVKAVTEHFEARGYIVEDVGALCLGWDLTCTRTTRIRRVEVKGVSSATPTVLLTENEVRSAREDKGWELAVVTTAADSPVVTLYSATEALAVASPIVYRAQLPSLR